MCLCSVMRNCVCVSTPYLQPEARDGLFVCLFFLTGKNGEGEWKRLLF